MAANTALGKVYDPQGVARALNIALPTAYGLLRRGEVRAEVKRISKYRVSQAALDEYREKRGNGHAKKPTAKR